MFGLIFLGYLAIGIVIAWMVDRSLMKQDVPYGELPSFFPLPILRRMVAVWMVIIGPAYAIYLLPGVAWDWFKDKYLA